MIIRFANVVYWVAASASVLIFVGIGITVATGGGSGPAQFLAAVFAVLVWLAGRVVLYVFADR